MRATHPTSHAHIPTSNHHPPPPTPDGSQSYATTRAATRQPKASSQLNDHRCERISVKDQTYVSVSPDELANSNLNSKRSTAVGDPCLQLSRLLPFQLFSRDNEAYECSHGLLVNADVPSIGFMFVFCGHFLLSAFGSPATRGTCAHQGQFRYICVGLHIQFHDTQTSLKRGSKPAGGTVQVDGLQQIV